MNTIEHTVTKVLSEPYFKFLWCVDVEADAYDSIQTTTVCFKTQEETKAVTIGYEFDA